MTGTLEYKGYIGLIQVDTEAGVLHGNVVNTRDVITFEAETVPGIQQAFIDSVEDYLNFCRSRGEDPEKPYSGKFQLRIRPDLHARAVLIAKREGKSLNKWVESVIERSTERELQLS